MCFKEPFHLIQNGPLFAIFYATETIQPVSEAFFDPLSCLAFRPTSQLIVGCQFSGNSHDTEPASNARDLTLRTGWNHLADKIFDGI